MKRTLSVLALSGTLAMMGAAGATAAQYPAPAPSVTVSDGTVAPGEAVTFSGSGFTPGETVNITATNDGGTTGGAGTGARSVGLIIAPLETTTATAVADSTGTFSTKVTLNETGTYVLTAKGATSGVVRTVTVNVVAPVAAQAAVVNSDVSGGSLAQTGFPLLAWSAVGIAALGGGAASVIAVRRKAATQTAS